MDDTCWELIYSEQQMFLCRSLDSCPENNFYTSNPEEEAKELREETGSVQFSHFIIPDEKLDLQTVAREKKQKYSNVSCAENI